MSSFPISIVNFLQILILIPAGLSTLYIFIFATAGLFYRQRVFSAAVNYLKIAVLIPGFREDEVITEVASDALLQEYPEGRFEVIVIADSFQAETLEKLRKLPVKVIEVSFDKSTKAKALNKAMEQLDSSYDIAVILDSDNLMARDFLTKVNAAMEGEIMAVQGHRTAKNLNTSFAILDAVSEEINNHIFRKGHRVLGLSSAIIGSGMAFRYGFFRDLMAQAKAVGGFDKEIELSMLRDGYKIEYIDDAYVYDEKVQKAEVFHNQRRRWLSAQLHYFRTDFLNALKALLLKGNIDYFDKAFQFIQPPRILLLGGVLFFGAVFIIFDSVTGNLPVIMTVWAVTMILCLFTFLFSIPLKFYNMGTLRALGSLPRGMLLMTGSLLKIKGANQSFIHTRHGSVPSDDDKK